MEYAPVLEVGDRSFDWPAEFVHAGVVGFVVLGKFVADGFLDGSGHLSSDIAFVGDELGRVVSVEQAVGVEGGDVVGGSGQGVGDPRDPSFEAGGDLHVDSSGVVFPRVQVEPICPGPAWEQGPVDQVHVSRGDILRNGDQMLQDSRDHRDQRGDRPADRGLRDPVAVCDVGLGAVTAQVHQRRLQRCDESENRRNPDLVMRVDDDVDQLLKDDNVQSRAILHLSGQFLSFLSVVTHLSTETGRSYVKRAALFEINRVNKPQSLALIAC